MPLTIQWEYYILQLANGRSKAKRTKPKNGQYWFKYTQLLFKIRYIFTIYCDECFLFEYVQLSS
jgi:hypothetical protein